MSAQFPQMRMRRLRRTQALRTLFRAQQLRYEQLIYPVFIDESLSEPQAIATMPGQFRWPEKNLAFQLEKWANLGLKAIMPFGVSCHKDAQGSDACNENGLLSRMVKLIKSVVPELVLIPDICFCEYTDHGHCGVLDDQGVNNDLTLTHLTRQAIVAAQAGADMIAPSAAMDGQIQAIRQGLDQSGFSEIPILAYSTKMASSLYGPFRAAAGSNLQGDRKTYQMDPANAREALRESLLDEAEGADILMVKPALTNLDLLHEIRQATLLPLAAYQVSGEYAMIRFAAQNGAINETEVMLETLLAIHRAGADLLLSYFTPEILERRLL